MNKVIASIIMSAAVGGIAGIANAEIMSGTITADNHYALYSSAGNVFSYHGGNELDAGGVPGTYNWSVAESYSFEAGDFLYIAAWSDDSVAQGVLAQFQSDTLGLILSGDPRWQVYGTNINRNDGDPHPDAMEIAGHVGYADSNALWEAPFIGGDNGVTPWGNIVGIDEEAQWMWMNSVGDPDPLSGGSAGAEMLIYRTVVPAPSSLAFLGLAGLGGLTTLRRRR
ncbi:MAG: PEP-CTERM sorting domain-containing protein [Pyrinomonadaceae bacterium]|nr:PEP-CTERM sorting domain-containing protein [Phycisphaerales bacterium]